MHFLLRVWLQRDLNQQRVSKWGWGFFRRVYWGQILTDFEGGSLADVCASFEVFVVDDVLVDGGDLVWNFRWELAYSRLK